MPAFGVRTDTEPTTALAMTPDLHGAMREARTQALIHEAPILIDELGGKPANRRHWRVFPSGIASQIDTIWKR